MVREVWGTAALRALLSAVVVGGIGFLGTWATTDEIKTLVIAGLLPALTVLATRFGLEGYVDAAKARKGSSL